MWALQTMGRSSPTDAGAHLGDVACPVLVIEGEAEPDWRSPQTEGEGIIAALPRDLGRLAVVPGSGHYPHVQHPREVLALVLPFWLPPRASGGPGARRVACVPGEPV